MTVTTQERLIHCHGCGPIAHQPIPDDQSHCPCWEIYDDEFGAGYREDCTCECHGGGSQ